MAFVGGDLIEITYNHPTLGSGTLFPKSSEDTTINLGGFRGADDANMVTGAGENIRQLNNSRWSVEATIAIDTVTKLETEKLVALAASPVEATWTFSHVSGSVYGGTGAPVGDLNPNLNASTMALKVAGGGQLKKLV